MPDASVTSSERLNTTAELLTMGPASDPVVPPSPSCKVPALTVVAPV